MKVSRVQENPNDNLSRQSFLLSAALGSLGCYSLKWAIPLLPQEKDEFFLQNKSAIEKKATRAGAIQLQKIKRQMPDGADEFLKMVKETTPDLLHIEPEDLNLPDNIKRLYTKVINKIKEVKYDGYNELILKTKNKSPGLTFVVGGLLLGLFSALVHNVRVENARNS